MAYTTRQAVDTFNYYLGTAVSGKYTISDTKDRGFVITLPSNEKIVVFVYPLVHKQDNTKNYFDTRDSGAYERSIAWKYAVKNNLKYFCLGINDQVDKYKEYIFSLECNEKHIEKISGTKDGARNGPGNQIIIPNDYVPSKKFERIRNKLGIFISVIHMDSLLDYLEKYDNRPYMSIESEDVDFEEFNKEKFKEWLSRQVKPEGDSDAGNPYAESSVNAYVDVISRQIITLDGQERSLFATVDYDTVNRAVEDEAQKPDTTKGRRVSALRKYRAFVAETNALSNENEYERAAHIVNDHILETGFEFEKTDDEINALIAEFNAKFSPENLMTYSDDELMEAMFYTAAQTNDSMAWWLEFHKDMRSQFGSIAGGTSLKYGIYQNKEEEWITGGSANKRSVSYEEALEIGKDIRAKLIKGVEIIRNSKLDTVEDYEKLHDALIGAIGSFATNNWVHKYFYMIFPDKFTIWHNEDWQKHALRALMIRPSEKAYGRSGQIALVGKYAHRSAPHLGQAFYHKFGGIKHFCRLGTSDSDGNYAEEWEREKIVAIGWQAVGNLDDYASQNSTSGMRRAIAESLKKNYYPNSYETASRKAGELQTFYNTGNDTVFVTMDGEKLIALADNIGNYFFDVSEAMCHRKPAIWHCCFDDDKLPKKAEGHMTSCFELKDDDNLMYLYKKYYYDLSEKEGDEKMAKTVEYITPKYHTGIKENIERNRIVFGAPGTGKSWLLKCDSEALLKGTDGTLERVTFHPDYTYSQFVGTYKPVSDSKGDIRYEFVAGPFMRVYVQAILSGRSENPQPHLLLIEEINRAKVAAVFGDVFQLLDRDDDGVSEYEIQTTKDVRKFLATELGGEPEQWDRIKLPDNMFIWATMNSADQGVFPMDTAFKRRWGFDYIGINDKADNKSRIIALGTSQEDIEWEYLRRAINDKLARDYKVNEDKLMGPYFLSKKIISTDGQGRIANPENFVKVFKSKVIMYLYEDAAKQHKHKLFAGCDSSKYSSVCDAFDKIGIGIFGEDFKSLYYDIQDVKLQTDEKDEE